MLSAIVAVSDNDVIGKEDDLPWHLPAELARFKQITMGHPIVMGRKTHESIGRALPGRTNIVITHDQNYAANGCLVANSLDEAIAKAETAKGSDEIFIIGGASIYEQALPRLAKIYLTRVQTVIHGDKFFQFNQSGWKLISSEKHPADAKNQFAFEFQQWIRP